MPSRLNVNADRATIRRLDATGMGFFGATPVTTQPAATAQSAVATTAITAVVTTAATTSSPAGYTTTTQANAIVTAINSLITRGDALVVLVNQLRSDLVTLGLIKGSN